MGEHADIKDRIKYLRTTHNMSQNDLAIKLGVDKVAVSQWERGVRKPKREMQDALCDIFNVNIEYLNGNWNYISRLVNEQEMLALDNGSLVSKDTPSIEPFSPGRYRIPIVGRIAAGLPIYNGGEIEGYIDYDKDPGKHVFALRIHGHSMEPRIMSGDLVIIDEEAGWEDGDIVAVTVNGDDGTCKRIKRYSDSIALIPINPDFDPQVYSSKQIQDLPVTVVGKVIELRARF